SFYQISEPRFYNLGSLIFFKNTLNEYYFNKTPLKVVVGISLKAILLTVLVLKTKVFSNILLSKKYVTANSLFNCNTLFSSNSIFTVLFAGTSLKACLNVPVFRCSLLMIP